MEGGSSTKRSPWLTARPRAQEGEDEKLELDVGKAQQRPATDLSSKTRDDQMKEIRYRSRRRSDQIRPGRAKSLHSLYKSLELPV